MILFAVGIHQMWYAVPLVIAISLVYAATRHEEIGPILEHAVRFGLGITGFMALVLAVFWAISLCV